MVSTIFLIVCDVIILNFAASFDNFHLITMNIKKVFHANCRMLQKSSAQFLGVNAKQDGNGIGDNVQVYYKWIQFKTMLIP